jgi:hypothetical protein
MNWYKKAKFSDYIRKPEKILQKIREEIGPQKTPPREEMLNRLESYDKNRLLSVIRGLKDESFSDAEVEDIDDILFMLDNQELIGLLEILKGNWRKTAQKVKWFEWEAKPGNIWTIQYRDIDSLYENGRALSNRVIMEKMIVSIQHKDADISLSSPKQIGYFLDKFISEEEFFDKVQETNNKFRDEQRIEQRDIDSGLIDLDIDSE